MAFTDPVPKPPRKRPSAARRAAQRTGNAARKTTRKAKRAVKKAKKKVVTTVKSVTKRRKRLAPSHLSRFILVLAALTILFLALLLAQQARIGGLRAEQARQALSIQDLEAQVAFYRDAYELTLQDARLLSAAYGGDERFERLARELREKELGTVLGTEVEGAYAVTNPELWPAYQRRGVIVDDCLSELTLPAEEFLLTVDANGPLRVYADGNYLYAQNGTASNRLTLADGVHELSLVAEGAVALRALHVDATAVDTGLVTADAGEAWAVFDCEDAARGAALTGPGAYRLLVRPR